LYAFPAPHTTHFAQFFYLAKQFGIPTLLWAQGVGPLQSEEAKELVRDIFTKADFVSLRDNASRDLVQSIGVDRKLKVAPDPVWALEFDEEHCRHSPERDANLVAVIVREWSFSPGWIDRLKAGLEILRDQGRRLRFVNFQGRADDATIREIARDLPSSSYEIRDVSGDPLRAADALVDASGVLAMRLHGLILSARLGLPVLSLEYDPKVSAAAEEAAIPGSCRLRLDEPEKCFVAGMRAFLKVMGKPATRAATRARRLAERADAHRLVLRRAIAAAQGAKRRGPWQSRRFDWLTTWHAGREKEFAREIGAISEAREQAAREIAGLSAQLSGANATIAMLAGSIATIGERLAKFEGVQASEHAERERLHAERDRLAREISERGVALERAVDELKVVRSLHAGVVQDLEHANAERARAETAVRGLADRARLDKERADYFSNFSRRVIEAAGAALAQERQASADDRSAHAAAIAALEQVTAERDRLGTTLQDLADQAALEKASHRKTIADLERAIAERASVSAMLERRSEALRSADSQLREQLSPRLAALDEALYRLRQVQWSRGWRAAKALRFARERILTGTIAQRIRSTTLLWKRVTVRKGIGVYDPLVHANSLIAESIRLLRSDISDLGAVAQLSGPPPHLPAPGPGATAASIREAERGPDRVGATRGVRGLVSIVLPVYNQANFLAEAIEGVLRQTYPHWELIVVDDGSTDDFDGTLAVHFRNSRIRVFRQPNQKLPSALNSGFANARGEYLTWTSADNVMLPDQIARLVQALEGNPAAGLVYSNYEAIDDRGAPLSDPTFRAQNRATPTTSVITLPREATLENLHNSGDNFIGASFLYRADVAAIVGCYDEETFGGEDYDYWLRAHLVAPFAHVEGVLYRYRVHDNTLNAKAKELGLFATIHAMLDAARQRRERLLATGELKTSTSGFLRDASQYHLPALAREIVPYSAVASGTWLAGVENDIVTICVIDAPLRVIEVGRLKSFDIVIASDEATYFWLKQQDLPKNCRLLNGPLAAISGVVDHCVALRSFEKEREREGHVPACKPTAAVHPSTWPGHVMLAVQVWLRGGLENVVLDLAASLAKQRVRVTIGIATGRMPEDLASRMRQIDVPIVAFEGDESALESYLTTRGVECVNYHHSLFGLDRAKRAGVAVVYTVHNSYVFLPHPKREEWKVGLQKMDHVIAVSRQVADYASASFALDPSRLSIVPNGVDLGDVLPKTNGSHDPGLATMRENTQHRFLHVGSFDRVKMQNVILIAFSMIAGRHPGVRLTLAGPPVDKAFYEEVLALRQKLNLQRRVDVIPGLAREQTLALMCDCDCVLLPSAIEGASIALLEAVLCGKPAIATDVGNARDLVAQGAAVRLIPAPIRDMTSVDSEAFWIALMKTSHALAANLADAMQAMLAEHTAYSDQARRSVAKIRRLFTLEAMALRYLDCFAAAAAQRGARGVCGAGQAHAATAGDTHLSRAESVPRTLS
jgi:glycosyltransferase involved in cell wall biosynthesis